MKFKSVIYIVLFLILLWNYELVAKLNDFFGGLKGRFVQASKLITVLGGIYTLYTTTKAFTKPNIGESTANLESSNTKTTLKRNVPAHVKKYVAASQGWKCKMCGLMLDANYEVDHIIPLCEGGTNKIDNLQALHAPCHSKKTFFDQIRGFF